MKNEKLEMKDEKRKGKKNIEKRKMQNAKLKRKLKMINKKK